MIKSIKTLKERINMLRRQMQLDFSGINTYSAENRHNLVTIDNMMTPGVTPHDEFIYDGFDELIDRIVLARKTVIR